MHSEVQIFCIFYAARLLCDNAIIAINFFFFFWQKSGPTVTKVVTVVTTKKAVVETEKKKGELMENDQDAMEVIEVSCVSTMKSQCASYQRHENERGLGFFFSSAMRLSFAYLI